VAIRAKEARTFAQKCHVFAVAVAATFAIHPGYTKISIVMVKELTELVSFVEHSFAAPEEWLAFLSKNNADVIKLFQVMQANTFRTEAEAVEKARIGERTKYRQVAKELLRCLEQMVAVAGHEKQAFDEVLNARVRGFQLTSVAKILNSTACKHSSKRNAEELLRLGTCYGRPEFVIEALKILMNYSYLVAADAEAYEHYSSEYEKYLHWRAVEEKAMIYFERCTLPFTKKKSIQGLNSGQSKVYLAELEPYVNVIPSHSFHLNFFMLKSRMFSMEASYKEASAVNEEAISYFESRNYSCDYALNMFYYSEIANCVHLGQYSRAREMLSKAVKYAISGSTTWFNTHELGFYLYMHEGDWAGAARLYAAAVKHKRFIVLRDAQRETWHILGAYLYIVLQLTGTELEEGLVPRFRSSRFRNDIKDFARDKTGMNIAILIAEALLDFVESKDRDLWDRIAALEKYRERYLRDGDATHRSQLFIKILTIFAKYDYDGSKFLQRAEPYLEELRQCPLQLANQAHELEIVPYEKLIQLLAQTAGVRWTADPAKKEKGLQAPDSSRPAPQKSVPKISRESTRL
jgi:hypothetical protein